MSYALQVHADQDCGQLGEYWGRGLDIPPNTIRFQPKSNSGQLRARVWRCRHGVMTVSSHDTLLRAKLQAWMDCIRSEWL